jgi:hypothetical protein
MEFLKTVTGKVLSGLVGLAVMAAAVSWWQMDQSTRDMLVSGTGRILGWLGVVVLLPWASFFVVTWVGRMDSNRAGAVLVAGYTLGEALVLAWLFDWSLPGHAAWTFFVVGVLLGAVYNVLVCDWIAEKLG